ncbi:hypothetical protein [Haloarcula sp. 1CSR25-25]|uniref:hypothetical protein n=1 Tax=Haloarcula sp. 1CSR25-25 TaxID=2862545 RepID=UPI002893DBC9|nr:hypothetical protein [Haloarcula sp. 1CSR25-25]MDT3435078.1 hypothetical protein [Haloarcula sp. 1CSR25-25]
MRPGGSPVWEYTAQAGPSDYTPYATDIAPADFDVTVLDLRGLDAVNGLRAFREVPKGDSIHIPSSGAAHIPYAQTLQYASAVGPAGAFEPSAVIGEPEGHEYDAGFGPQTPACDHQAMQRVPGRYANPLGEVPNRFETEAEHEFVFSGGPSQSLGEEENSNPLALRSPKPTFALETYLFQ